MSEANVPHRFEYELEVSGSPEQVWRAIASAEGITSWMMPTELEAREGGTVVFHMGPDDESRGHVTAFEPATRIVYEEDWATLVGHAGAPVTPLVTEFLVEARAGGSCVVRVVTSAFGTGADWENEFFDEMASGWAPMLDNLRLYLAQFPDQHATSMWCGATFGAEPEAAIAALKARLGVEEVGDAVQVMAASGRLERSLPRHFLLRQETPVPGFLSFSSFQGEDGSGVHLQGYLFSDGAPAYVEEARTGWQAWLDAVAAERATSKTPS